MSKHCQPGTCYLHVCHCHECTIAVCAVVLALQMDDSAPCKLALATTWSGDLWGLRKELIPWLTYHAYLGVSKLYVLYEGSDPRTLRVSRALPNQDFKLGRQLHHRTVAWVQFLCNGGLRHMLQAGTPAGKQRFTRPPPSTLSTPLNPCPPRLPSSPLLLPNPLSCRSCMP